VDLLSAPNPLLEIFVGTVILIAVMFVHGVGIRAISWKFSKSWMHVTSVGGALAPEPGARSDDHRLGNPAFCRNADLVGASLCAFNHPVDARQPLFRFGELHNARGRQCYPARSMASARTDHWHVGIIHLRMVRKCSGQHHDRCWKVRYAASETRAFRRWSSIMSIGRTS
jgi:hypothetical protein